MSTSTGTVRLTMPARAEYLILARLALAGIAREIPMNESTLADLKLAVTEVCGNAVRHAYPDDPGVVRISFDVTPTSIDVTVEDEGLGLALDEVPEELHLDGEPLEGGMGLAIIRAVMDELVVEERADGPGTLVRMGKRLTPA